MRLRNLFPYISGVSAHVRLKLPSGSCLSSTKIEVSDLYSEEQPQCTVRNSEKKLKLDTGKSRTVQTKGLAVKVHDS